MHLDASNLFHRLASRAATFVARCGGPNGQAPRSIWVILLPSFFLFFARALSFATDSAHPSLCPTIPPAVSLLRTTGKGNSTSTYLLLALIQLLIFIRCLVYLFICLAYLFFFLKYNNYASRKSTG